MPPKDKRKSKSGRAVAKAAGGGDDDEFRPRGEEAGEAGEDAGSRSGSEDAAEATAELVDDITPEALIANLKSKDDFMEDEQLGVSRIHIRVHRRNGRSFITTVQGLPEDLDLKKILRACRKNFHCNGALVPDKEKGSEVIQLQGDQRHILREFLCDQEICREDELVIHGH